MTYADWLQAMLTILQVADPDGTAAFTAMAPRFIEYGELRILRKFDFLATRVVDASKTTTAGSRAIAIPSNFIVIEGVSLVTPASTAPFSGQRVPLKRTTREFIDAIWPTESAIATPDSMNPGYWTAFSMQETVASQTQGAPGSADEPTPLPSDIIIAPTPDNTYRVEFTGTQRPTSLSAANPTTFISNYLPDLFLVATMVIASGYQRDFGQQSADPAMAVSWSRLFDELAQDVMVEELRKKSVIDGYSSLLPPAATPPVRLAAQAQQQMQPG